MFVSPVLSLRVAVLGLLVIGMTGGCSGGGSTPPDAGGTVRATLRFAAQPADGLAGLPFAEPLRVAVTTDGGALPPSARVVIRLEGGPEEWLEGTPTQPLEAGEARFDDLRVAQAAAGLSLLASLVGLEGEVTAEPVRSASFRRGPGTRRHLILMIADGWGYQHIAATRSFTGKPGSYSAMRQVAMTTWDATVQAVHGDPAYDPQRAWTDLAYLTMVATDSASSATAMYTGVKTHSGRVAVGPEPVGVRLTSIGDLARANRVGVGAVTSVPVSHATPAGWLAHNESRNWYRAICDEMLFGDPAATGTPDGARGPTPLLPDLLIGGGHPARVGQTFVTRLQLERAARTGWTVVQPDGDPAGAAAAALLAAAATAPRLFGVFGGEFGNLPFRRHDGSGLDPMEPTLAEMTRAALVNLGRHPAGFCLMVEGGAVDWAGHANDMSGMLGEMIGFDEAVAAVIDWVDEPGNGSDWSNTLLIVTGDHETGLLTAGPTSFPDRPLGAVTDPRIRAEKIDNLTGRRASWDDRNGNDRIDLGENPEEVYWMWHTVGHANTLIPCYLRGLGSDRVDRETAGTDPVRGTYIDNTAVFRILLDALAR